VPIVLNSGSFNLLEPSGPVQACNGIDLLFIMNTFTDWNTIEDGGSVLLNIRKRLAK
jgi:hypothetical protein